MQILTIAEVAAILRKDKRSVYRLINRKYDPLPAKDAEARGVSAKHQRVMRVYLSALADAFPGRLAADLRPSEVAARGIALGLSIEEVAGLLGNTTTVALRAYVDISAESDRLKEAAKKI